MYYLYYETACGNSLIPYSSIEKLKSELQLAIQKGFHPKILTDYALNDLSYLLKK